MVRQGWLRRFFGEGYGWPLVLAFALMLFTPYWAMGSVSVTVNGVSYTIPQTNERNWGTNVTSWIQAISSNTLQPTGGTFTLGADIDFGASFGLKSGYYKSRTANISSAGQIRLANTDTLCWRNSANGANLCLNPNVSTDGVLQYNSVDIPTISSTHTLTNKTISFASNTFASQLAVANGGTGAATANAGLNALLPSQGSNSGKALVTNGTDTAWTSVVTNPMTTGGDIIYGGASGTPTRLANGSSGQHLISSGSTTAPTWGYPGITSKSTNYTAVAADDTIVFTATATLAFPAAAGVAGKIYHVISSGAAVDVTVDPNGAETVCGRTTVLLTGNEHGDFQSDGTNWQGLGDSCKFTGWANVNTTCTSTPCTIAAQSGDWIGATAWTRSATGSYAITFKAGTFGAAPVCTFSSGSVANGDICAGNADESTSGVSLVCTDAATPSSKDEKPRVVCTGYR